MGQARPGFLGSRRTFLLAWLGFKLTAAGWRGAQYPSESATYVDEVAEFEVTRLTDESFNSWLPSGNSRFISSQRNLLLYSSERTGSTQAFRLDLDTGHHRQLTEAAELDSASPALLEDDSGLVYIDGRDLFRADIDGGNPRRIYSLPQGWQWGEGFAVNEESNTCAFVENGEGRSRVRVLEVLRGRDVSVLERPGTVRDPLPQPGRESLVYRSADGLRLAEYSGGEGRRILADGGTLGPVRWDSSGRSLFYLRLRSEEVGANQIREYIPDSNEDRLVADAGGVTGFARNANGTVFAGVRGRDSGAGIILFLRTGSELTICEHGSSEVGDVVVAFSPDGRRLYFHSNRDGKNAIYTTSLEGLVEPTGA